MVALLEAKARQAQEDDYYVGDRQARRLRAELAQLAAGAPALRRWSLHRELGIHELRLGNTDEALRHLAAAYDLLPMLVGELELTQAADTIYQLAVGHLRAGETANCVHRHTADSCILPIRGGGVHVDPTGSENAIRYFRELLERPAGAATETQRLSARWLLNIAYMTLGQYPDDVPEPYRIAPETFASKEPAPRLVNIAAPLGLNTFGLSGGVIVDDFDNDGDLDLVASDWHPAAQIRYFVNNHDGTFTDRTEAAGLTGITGGLNLRQADYDNDGYVDILVLRGAWGLAAGRQPNSLLRNNGDGTFTDVTFDAGLAEVHYPTQTASWGDYDNDGDLDLYIGNEYVDRPRARLRFSCQLFRNNGDGTFTDVARAAGVENNGYTKGVMWGDYDGDRFVDLYVSNLSGPNRLYHNNHDGTFTDVAPRLGVTRPDVSFPTWFWDYDNDGYLDIFVASYWFDTIAHVAASYLGLPHKAELACLYRNNGRGGFDEVAVAAGLTRVTQPMGSNFGDLDNDGYLDFLLGTGYPDYEGLSPNVMYRNLAGSGFADITTAAGLGHLQKGHGVAFADLDHDGDQDIFMCIGGAYPGDGFGNALFENPGFSTHWIVIKLVGVRSNRSAIGVRIRAEIVEPAGRRNVYRHVNCGGSFGASPLRQHIGLGQATRIETLEIFWPTSGTTQTFRNVVADQFIEITEGQDTYTKRPYEKFVWAGR